MAWAPRPLCERAVGYMTAPLACCIWLSAFSLSQKRSRLRLSGPLAPDVGRADSSPSPPIYNRSIMQTSVLRGGVVPFNALSNPPPQSAQCVSCPWRGVAAGGGPALALGPRGSPFPPGKSSLFFRGGGGGECTEVLLGVGGWGPVDGTESTVTGRGLGSSPFHAHRPF